ncbi:MAG TPA: PAS domain S-box protein [Candidatus Dormibacteraeota bacterium]|jgi:two-component system cell cycle sensor histidine kinase/response regulator CckA|nr:PAS domain S-box protein [Candidatus Dormibacteraeota bacterium]
MSLDTSPEEGLLASSTTLKALLDFSGDLLAVFQADRTLSYVNEAFTRVLGYSSAELLGNTMDSIHHPLELRAVLQKFSQAQSDRKQNTPGRCRLRSKEGLWLAFDFEVSNHLHTPGIEGVLVSFRNVNDLRRLQAERQVISDVVHALNHTSNLDQLLSQIHQALKKVVYAENCFVALREPATEMFHFAFYVDQFDPPPPPQKIARTCMAYVFRTGEAQLIPQKEFDRLAAEGEVELVGSASPAWLGVPLKTPTETIGVLVVQHYQNENAYDQRDLEFIDSVGGHIALAIERRRSEEALRKSESMFRLLFSRTPLPKWVFDMETGKFLLVNEAATKQYGYTEEEFRRMTVLDLRPASERNAGDDIWRHPSLSVFHQGQWRHQSKDGRVFKVELATHELEYGGRRVRLVIAQDISERQLLEEQLRQAQKMEAVGRLAGGVAHDFNNLLMVIKGHTELLLGSIQPEDPSRRKIEQIDRSADRATSLTRQLLAFSRMQVLQPRSINLNSIVDEMGKLIPRLIGEDIELAIHTSPDLGTIRADASQMEQIIMNLAVNARDAMPKGGKLIIETSNTELDGTYRSSHPVVKPGRYILLAVSDTGIGMDVETQAHIFEPFFTTKEQGKGTGLGLSTVYGVVKQSGGFIWVYSEKGKGATFKIYLPRVDEAADEVGHAHTSTQVMRGTETVLLAEDEQDVREVAREFLESAGYTVILAANGEEAIARVEEQSGQIDLLVTDMIMPGMTGLELVRRLRQHRLDFGVIYMSGYSEQAAAEATKADQTAIVLTKPFSRIAILRAVREVLQNKPKK